MKTREILSKEELAAGADIVSALNLKVETKKARRNARAHLAMMTATGLAALINIHPMLQLPSIWAVTALSGILLARSIKPVSTALRKTRLTKAAASQIQHLLGIQRDAGQAFAYQFSGFQPDMTLAVATLAGNNYLKVTTYKVGPGQAPKVEVEERQVYVKAWLSATFNEKWERLAESRGMAASRFRVSLNRLSGGMA